MISLLEEVKVNIKSCLVAVGGKTTIELLEKDYQDLLYERIPNNKLGHSTTESFLRSIPEMLRITGSSKSAIVELIKKNDSKSQHIQQMVAVQKTNKKFQEQFHRSANCLMPKKVIKVFSLQNKEPQGARKIAMPSKINKSPPLNTMHTNIKDFKPLISSFNNISHPEVPEERKPSIPHDKMFLANMATYNDAIPVRICHNILQNMWTRIKITVVHDTCQFFFQSPEDIADANELMLHMELFYNRDVSKILTPALEELQSKLIVAVYFNAQWHRARIIFVLQQMRRVCLYLIDCGTINVVPANDVRYLHKKFLEKPQLCHRASLSGFQTLGGSCGISKMFQKCVNGHKVIAHVTSYETVNMCWYMELVTVHSSSIIFNINKYLKGIIATQKMCDELEFYRNFYINHQRNNLSFFPNMIFNGKYPSSFPNIVGVNAPAFPTNWGFKNLPI